MQINVVVGRFQVPKLHNGHQQLLKAASQTANVLCVMLGVTENRGSKKDPLDFITRKMMLEDWLRMNIPTVSFVIAPIKDSSTDEDWSKNLDSILSTMFPGARFSLFGGRESFLNSYSGSFETVKFSNQEIGSGTTEREAAASNPKNTNDFRSGVVYGVYNNWPRLFMCVDAAVVTSKGKILMGRKKNETKFRFFGGFVDQNDQSLEVAAMREAYEECGLSESKAITFLGSTKIDDHRYYSKETGLVMTSFFMLRTYQEIFKAGDDICEVKEFDLSELSELTLVPAHMPLLEILKTHLERDSQ